MLELPVYSVVIGQTAYKGVGDLVIVKERKVDYNEDLVLTKPEMLANYVYNMFKDVDDVEYMLSIPLNSQNIPIGYHVVAKGTANACTVMPRDVFRTAVMLNACSIVLAHTHPSGNCTPSEADKTLTNKLMEAGNVLDIKLLDHVVVGMGAAMTYKSILY